MHILPDDVAAPPPDVVAADVLPDIELPSARRALTAVPDRATREAAAAIARMAYCAQLKEVRERRGVSLAEIAERSKVNEGLYAALERADVSRWPTGIYRRSFFRGYAMALGLPVDSALSEFLQLFPDDGEQRTSPALATPPGPLRITLADHVWLPPSRTQTYAALLDLAVVVLITAMFGWIVPVSAGTVLAVVAVIYFSLATACLACSPGTWWLRSRGNRNRAKALRLTR
jgi:transcriptional regulator with XRE-family HTH domain